ncbi:hypothetical protein FI667_g12456, partial [Globisporangium splendens]
MNLFSVTRPTNTVLCVQKERMPFFTPARCLCKPSDTKEATETDFQCTRFAFASTRGTAETLPIEATEGRDVNAFCANCWMACGVAESASASGDGAGTWWRLNRPKRPNTPSREPSDSYAWSWASCRSWATLTPGRDVGRPLCANNVTQYGNQHIHIYERRGV